MGKLLFLTLLLTQAILQSQACHPEKSAVVDDGENQDMDPIPGTATRMKRSFHTDTLLSLKDYFVSCMRSFRRFRPIDIQTIVRFTIDETSWYEQSDLNFCTSDTVNCWQNILYRYMNRNSELFVPALICMRKYGDFRGRPSDKLQPLRYYAQRRFRRRRQTSPSFSIDAGATVNQLRRAIPGFQGDFASLIQFFQQDVICSPGICDCRGIALQPGEVCGENWYTRLGAMIRTSSPLRLPLVYTLNGITQAAALEQRARDRRQRQQRQQQLLLQAVLVHGLANRNTTPLPTTVPTTTTITTSTTTRTTTTTPMGP